MLAELLGREADPTKQLARLTPILGAVNARLVIVVEDVEEQNLCMDKGYDYPDVRELVADWGYTAREGKKYATARRFRAIDRADGWSSVPIPGSTASVAC